MTVVLPCNPNFTVNTSTCGNGLGIRKAVKGGAVQDTDAFVATVCPLVSSGVAYCYLRHMLHIAALGLTSGSPIPGYVSALSPPPLYIYIILVLVGCPNITF